MDISVIIPTFNRSAVLEQTLRALAEQRFEPGSGIRFEVIVVDDGSRDDTPQVCTSIADGYPVPLRYRRQENRKQGAARNRGASIARGGLLVFLGDDTVPCRDFLAAHLRAHAEDDPLRAAIGYTRWAEGYPATRFMRYIGEYGWQFGFSLIEDPENVPFNFFYTSNLSLPRLFFQKAGGFDEDFREYGWEDIELSWRLSQMGMRLVYRPAAVAHHHHPTTMRSFLSRQRRVGHSAWTFFGKHPEMGDFLNVGRVKAPSVVHRLKLELLTRLCCWTERLSWPDLSRYYPDILSHHYNLGLLRARDG